MQVHRILSNRPSFNAIKIQEGLLENNKCKAISDSISTKLNQINPYDKEERTYVQMAEDRGYNILLTKGKLKDSVRADVVLDRIERQAHVLNVVPTNPYTHIGTYSEPDQFKIDHFNKTYNKQEKDSRSIGCVLYGMLALFGTLAALEIGYIIKKDIDLYRKMNNIEHTLKDKIKLSGLRPAVNDTIQAIPKIIK